LTIRDQNRAEPSTAGLSNIRAKLMLVLLCLHRAAGHLPPEGRWFPRAGACWACGARNEDGSPVPAGKPGTKASEDD
jgi:hypothetical protein